MAGTLRLSASTSSLLVTVCNTPRAAATSTAGTPQDRARRSAATASTDAGPSALSALDAATRLASSSAARTSGRASMRRAVFSLYPTRRAASAMLGATSTAATRRRERASSVVIRGQISRPRRPARAAFASQIRSTSPGLTLGAGAGDLDGLRVVVRRERGEPGRGLLGCEHFATERVPAAAAREVRSASSGVGMQRFIAASAPSAYSDGRCFTRSMRASTVSCSSVSGTRP